MLSFGGRARAPRSTRAKKLGWVKKDQTESPQKVIIEEVSVLLGAWKRG